jgi:hypothetical protein
MIRVAVLGCWLSLGLVACGGDDFVERLCEHAEEHGCSVLGAASADEDDCRDRFLSIRSGHEAGCDDAYEQWLECIEEEVRATEQCLEDAELEATCEGQVAALAECDEALAGR